ncbi:MAG: hypothetical protein HY951_10660 [Bacteroidia bacterium]|nr:hypothetical protein [Bacteroidia bacterium]
MKKISKIVKNCMLLFFIFTTSWVYSQDSKSASEYMGQIGNQHQIIMENIWDYTSSVSHGKSARKVEKRRKEVIKAVEDAQKTVGKLKPFGNDASYRDSVLSYLNISHIVLTENYGKIVDMEAIAEQSYDAMEAYLLAQEIANQKMDLAEEMMVQEQKNFAAAHNITLLENKDPLAIKMKKASEVIKYYNVIYLIYFKSSKQEAYLMEALNKADLNSIEQNRTTLAKYAKEGLGKLEAAKSYSGDLSMNNVTKQSLKFYIDESEVKMQKLTNYYLEKEKFDKIKSAFDAKSQSSRTKQDVDQFNAAVNAFNKAAADSNVINNELNNSRSQNNENWNKVAQAFLDKHVPKK